MILTPSSSLFYLDFHSRSKCAVSTTNHLAETVPFKCVRDILADPCCRDTLSGQGPRSQRQRCIGADGDVQVWVQNLQRCHFSQDLTKCPNSSTEANTRIFLKMVLNVRLLHYLSVPEGGSCEQNQWLQERHFHPPAPPKQVSQANDNIGLVCCSRPFFAPLRRAEPAGTLPPKAVDPILSFLSYFLCHKETRHDGMNWRWTV